jgi:hypothetical protein
VAGGAEALAVLARWVEHGGALRLRALGDAEATVELCTCYGDAVDELTSSDPVLLTLLRDGGTPVDEVLSPDEAEALLGRSTRRLNP